MDNSVEDLTFELSKEIKKLPEAREFLRLKELLEKDKNLRSMRVEIAKLTNENKLKERDNLLKEYNSVPLVANYYSAREDLYNILKEISNILK